MCVVDTWRIRLYFILSEILMRLIVLNEQMEESIEKIEAVISDLVRNSEDLSDIVAAQDKEISRIKDSLQWLLERELERQNAENTATDEKLPPHW